MELYSPATGLLLLAAVFASAAMLIMALAFLVAGKSRPAWRILKVWIIAAGVYSCAWFASAMLPRTSAMRTGLPYCDDDLCMTVLNVTRTPGADRVRERFDIRLISRANDGTRSAKDTLVYLSDDRNNRFTPVDTTPVPFDVEVQPGKSVDTALAFDVPPDERKLYFEVRQRRLSYANLAIGNGTPWQPLLRLAVSTPTR